MPPSQQQQAKSMAQSYLQKSPELQYSNSYTQAGLMDSWNKMNQWDDKQFARSQQVANKSAEYTMQQANADRASREKLAQMQVDSINYGLKPAGGGATMHGSGAWTTTQRMADPYGMSGMKIDFEGIKRWNEEQNMALMNKRAWDQADAEGQGARARQVAMAQVDADRERNNMNIDMMNRQASLDVQKDAANRYAASAEAKAERDSRERMSMWNSISGAINGGGLGFQYWGGRV